jgi:hypothetical protein
MDVKKNVTLNDISTLTTRICILEKMVLSLSDRLDAKLHDTTDHHTHHDSDYVHKYRRRIF